MAEGDRELRVGEMLDRRAEQGPPEPILRFFEYEHLPPALQVVSKPFQLLAVTLRLTLPRNAERSVALRKLLEAKDAAVRAALPERPAEGYAVMDTPAPQHEGTIITIVVNGVTRSVRQGHSLTYRQIVELSDLGGEPSVTWYDGSFAAGTLTPGDSITPTPGTRFTIAHTGGA